MSLPRILKINEITPVERGNNIKTYPLAGEMIGSTVLSNGITCFPKGGGIPLHTHNVEETVTILEGEGICELPDGVHPVKPFDTSFVPAGGRPLFPECREYGNEDPMGLRRNVSYENLYGNRGNSEST